jgi:translation elongation factor EF-1beta
MSRVAIIFKIYPKEGKIEEAMQDIKSKLSPAAIQEFEVAFGIKIIKARFVFEDKNTKSSILEEQLKSINGVNEVEVEEESLI